MSESYAQRITCKLQVSALQPVTLELIDDSARHAGHAGAQPGGETHFKLVIVSQAFDGLSRVKRHQCVYELLKDELNERVHALNIKAMTPDEARL